jgi:hypothetical protein
MTAFRFEYPGRGATEAKTYCLSKKRAELNRAAAGRQPSFLGKINQIGTVAPVVQTQVPLVLGHRPPLDISLQ